jgi:hypothetical protein
MSQLDEGNIGATIVALRAAAVRHGTLPVAIQLVEGDEALQAHAWRRLAIEWLEKREALKQQAEAITLR